jgi:hypothetical protein
MLAMNAPRERHVRAYHVVMTGPIAGYIADKVLTGSHVEGRPVTHDQPQHQECLWRDTVVIRAVLAGLRRAWFA